MQNAFYTMNKLSIQLQLQLSFFFFGFFPLLIPILFIVFFFSLFFIKKREEKRGKEINKRRRGDLVSLKNPFKFYPAEKLVIFRLSL
jgi:hypothetical protein